MPSRLPSGFCITVSGCGQGSPSWTALPGMRFSCASMAASTNSAIGPAAVPAAFATCGASNSQAG